MAKIFEAKPRNEVDSAFQWDLTTIFPDDEAFETALAAFPSKAEAFQTYQGTLGQGVDQVITVLEALLAVSRELETLYVYAHLKHDQDTNNNKYLTYNSQAGALLAQVSEKISWFEPEVLSVSEDVQKALENHAEYGHFFRELFAKKAHVLSPEAESLLAGASEIFGNASSTFSLLNNADLKFGKVKDEDGNEVTLSHGSYGVLLESTDRLVREKAFKQLYASYESVKNTNASLMSGNIKGHNYTAKIRHYDSARQKALDNNNIPESVYDTLVDTVRKNTHLLHEYVALRKDMLGIEDLQMWDMYTPLTGDAPIKFTYEEAKEITFKALAPLGDQYLKDLEKAFDEKWIDVYENEGKRSGAYSSGAYDTNPYILLNWQDSLNDLYTLVHELGHSMHSYYTRSNQPYIYGDYSIFVAEIASTTNENLLTSYLLDTLEDKDAQIYILNHYLDGVKGTIFRQTQFAEFEQFMHESDAKGQPLTADFLSENYFELNKVYYGPSIGEDKTIALEWSRIPHFYMNYYVYQYATGFSAANTLAKRLVEGEDGAVDKYLTYLKSGSSDYPINVMQKAGIDMTNATYIEETFAQFEQRLAELKFLLNK
ncbi:oligoendopeptidase F [Aerococcus urinaeequi]|uniref:Oligopeptidase F n=1 Tax=Aerococcus viridans TaxID=1377 RepID=A0A2N6UD17_9LACT|nr:MULTISPECIES: oligoendopeptidase F [Aerococcus]OFU51361.1 oligoendopeptidase F [Aerococcus sp. HMSC10H05]PMC79458.1 oligoendopeptidase F [Aerococcus viridans]